MPKHNGESKSIPQLSNTAKLLRAYMMATGIACAKALADALDIPVRTIQRLKLDIAVTPLAPLAPDAPPMAQCSERTDATHGASGADLARADIYNNNPLTKTISVSDATQEPKPRQRGTRLPADWRLPKAWGEWTQVNFVKATPDQIRSEADAFRDFWIAKPGASATKLDWQATWRNWCRNSKTLTGVQARKGANSYNPNVDLPIKLNPNGVINARPVLIEVTPNA